ncbi:STAS/SEC14 domain-containing protein [Hymenobacter fodinae]|uniref:STAS/SEC14 domain-containing protein n=1 Tax=Hymenobacter fodinae TaxID=2510796 RepID=A0A4Z0P1A1_9BACT|nr:STAS/SEC14 domain-containing protein [Hymenobacter fodinae]TGE04936.1 STAS/SEC14 domain-containing protein [Hymenobacter fodinae]
MPIILTNEAGKTHLTIQYDAANHWVYTNWIGYQTFENVVAGAMAYLAPIRENKCPYLLNDNRLLLGLWHHSLEWAATVWRPQAMEAGLTHFAHVVDPDSMATVTADQFQKGINRDFHMRVFSDIEEAKAWLREAQQADAEQKGSSQFQEKQLKK